MLKIFLLLFSLQGVTFTDGEHFQTEDQQLIDSLQEYEFVSPKFSEALMNELSNQIPIKEKKVLSFRFQGEMINIQLTLNRHLFSPNFFERHVTDGGYKIVNESLHNCYFHGHVIGQKETSFAAVSICHGIEGSFTMNDKTLIIQPVKSLQGEVSHIVFESELMNSSSEFKCGHNHSENAIFSFESIIGNVFNMNNRVRRDVLSETKYVELVIINSKSQYEKYGSMTSTRAIKAVNYADSTYRVHNIRIVLVMIETWTVADQITLSETNNDESLKIFNKYKKNVLDANKKTRNDHAVFITQQKLANGRHGYAGIRTICSQRSTSLLYDYWSSISIGAAVMAHEIGHSLGLQHITVDKCPCGKSYCLMSARVLYSPLKISNCTEIELRKIFLKNYGVCLFNQPIQHYRHDTCGNNWIDKDEECDCGTAEECAAKNNSCCNPDTCQLYSPGQCSEGACCEDCKIRPEGALCRDKVNDCDLPEYCNGNSSICPADSYVRNGRPCSLGEEKSLCYIGVCHTYDSQCKMFWGPDSIAPKSNCYERLNVKGTNYGYCKDLGNKTYMKCDRKDVKCGKLQCEFSSFLRGGRYPKIGHSISSLMSGPCWSGTSYLGSDLPVAGMVETGSMCAENKVCYNNTCTDVSRVYEQPECPNNCSGHGICNNLGHCHCDHGYGCLTCSDNCDSIGGSVDSGNNCYCSADYNLSTTVPTTLRVSSDPGTTKLFSATEITTSSRRTETTSRKTTPRHAEATQQITEATTSHHESSRAITESSGGNGEKNKEEREVLHIILSIVSAFALLVLFLLCYVFRSQSLERCRKIRSPPSSFMATKSSDYSIRYSSRAVLTDGQEVGNSGRAEIRSDATNFTSLPVALETNPDSNVLHHSKLTSVQSPEMNGVTSSPVKRSSIASKPALDEISETPQLHNCSSLPTPSNEDSEQLRSFPDVASDDDRTRIVHTPETSVA